MSSATPYTKLLSIMKKKTRTNTGYKLNQILCATNVCNFTKAIPNRMNVILKGFLHAPNTAGWFLFAKSIFNSETTFFNDSINCAQLCVSMAWKKGLWIHHFCQKWKGVESGNPFKIDHCSEWAKKNCAQENDPETKSHLIKIDK